MCCTQYSTMWPSSQTLGGGLSGVVAHRVAGGRSGRHGRMRVVEERRQAAAAAGHRAELVRSEAHAGRRRVSQRRHLVLVVRITTSERSRWTKRI